MKITPGDVFSREKLNESTKAISDKLSAKGYAFANVNAAPELDKEKRQVAFTAVSYTHLDVYKRQDSWRTDRGSRVWALPRSALGRRQGAAFLGRFWSGADLETHRS